MSYIEIKNPASINHHIRILKNSIFLADTSFLIEWRKGSSVVKRLVKKLFEKTTNSSIMQNIIVRQELINVLKKHVAGECIYDHLDKNGLLWLIESKSKDFDLERIRINDRNLKSLRRSNSKIFRESLKAAKEELKSFDIFEYISLPKAMSNSNWKNLEKIVFQYGFGSSDAMIANFVLEDKDVSGLITCDSDFLVLKREFQKANKKLVFVPVS